MKGVFRYSMGVPWGARWIMDRVTFRRVLSSLVLLSCFPHCPLAAVVPLKDFDRPRLVETGELQGLLSHPSVRMIDMRSSFSDYLKGHLPNAVYLHVEALRVPEGGIPAQVPDQISLERLLGENLSVTNAMGVIVYSEKSNPNGTTLAWILDFLGHRRVGVLNGGWEKWVSENHPTAQEYPGLFPKKYFGKGIQGVLAEKKWVQSHLASKDVVIVDARSPKQYSGEEGEEIRKGHIPGARNFFWENTLEGDEVSQMEEERRSGKARG